MYVYALFDNESSELVTIHFLNAASNKLLELYMQSYHSPKVRESAKTGIECAYEIIFSGEIEKYIQRSSISVTPKDFKQQVDGSSAGLAYAVAFAAALKYRNIIETPCDIPARIAATGELDNHGNVTKVKHLKSKILAAIKENVNLMLYPSDNHEELQILQESDIDFNNAIKDNDICLKHVSNLKQAFCEIGIFPFSSLSLNPLSINEKDISFDLTLSNECKTEFTSFNLILKYDASKLKLENILEGAAIKDSKYLEFISPEKTNKKFILTLNLKKENTHLLKNNSTLIKINFSALDNLRKYNSNLLEFCEDESSINDLPCKGAGGFVLQNTDKSLFAGEAPPLCNQTAKRKHTSNKSAKTQITTWTKSLYPHNKKLLIASVVVLCFLFYYIITTNIVDIQFIAKVQKPLSESSPTVSIAYGPIETVKPLATSTPVLITAPSSPALINSTLPTPQPTSSPELVISLNTPTPAIVNDVIVITPKPELLPIKVQELLNPANWENKSNYANAVLNKDEDQKAFRIYYDIKGSGQVKARTESDIFKNMPDGYSALKFSYKCLSEIYSKDIVLFKIYYNNNIIPKSYISRSTESISKDNKWIEESIENIDVNKITAIEIFIGTVGEKFDEIDSGNFLIRDIFVSP